MRVAALIFAIAISAHAQWSIQTPTTADLRGIDNVGQGIVWASGTDGTVLRSEDAGYLWQACTIPPGAEHLDFRGIQAFDANTAIVMSSGTGDQSRLYKTTDGCQTWTLQTTNSEKEGFWDAVVFQHGNYGYAIGDSQTAVLIGDPVNGRFQTEVMLLGHGWFIDGAGCTASVGEAAFAASNSSIFVFGSRRYILGTGGKAGASVLISPLMLNTSANDPCLRVSVPIGSSSDSSGIFSLFFRDIDHGIAVGGDYTKPDESNRTGAWTIDMGRHWTASKNSPHGYRSAVAYDAPTKTWITVGPNGTDISTDDGRNWRPLHPTGNEAPDADQHWNALSLPYAVGPHGRVGILNRSTLKPASTKP